MDRTVRPYRDEDFSPVWALERARDSEGYTSAVVIRQAAVLWPGTFLVVDEEGMAVGYVIGAVSADPSEGWILRLKVRSDRHRRGCARALLAEVTARLRDMGVLTLRLTVAPDNTPARALYERFGFKRETLLPDYFGPGEVRFQLAAHL
jgi:ribosomal protein S18 acetylase RimI-like enzyme